MSLVTAYLSDLRRTAAAGWDRFWFHPTDPATLGLIRILTGAMLLYTHAVWSLELEGFLSEQGQLPEAFSRAYHDSPFAWSYLYWIESTEVLWVVHGIGLIVLLLFTLGLFTPVTGVLSFVITVSYANRAAGSLFGLDQINGFLSLYLAIGPAGAAYSVDHWWKRRRGPDQRRRAPSVGANVAIRLIQLHLCLLYLVAACGKLRSDAWWDGDAIWSVLVNYEYQTVDMLWLGKFPLVLDFFTHATIVFELGYAALIWFKLTRPIYLLMAVGVHLTIGICVGMMTFGLIMIVANMAFLSPQVVRYLLEGRRVRVG